ncbi:MAG: hypothetical protein ACYTET_03015 [Planctomycetota bacterium]|jgi:hypothetical protein
MKNSRVILAAVGIGVMIGMVLVSILPQQAGAQSKPSEQVRLLTEINQGIKLFQKSLIEKESGNMAFMGQGLEQAEVYVWDNEGQRWYTQLLSGKGQKIFESNGNFCAYAQVGTKIHFAAWNKVSKRWTPMTRYAEMIDIIPCDGSFGFFTTNQDAGVWTSRTDSWNTRRIVGKYVTSGGADNPPRYQHPEIPPKQ